MDRKRKIAKGREREKRKKQESTRQQKDEREMAEDLLGKYVCKK